MSSERMQLPRLVRVFVLILARLAELLKVDIASFPSSAPPLTGTDTAIYSNFLMSIILSVVSGNFAFIFE